MSQNILMSDDDVADLIASEARESALKYSTMGVGAFTNSSRQAKATVFSVYGWCRRANSVLAFRPPAASKIKPNTRFLRHIIKETKNHTEALLAREGAGWSPGMCGVARWETSRLFSKVASARGTGPPRRHARGRRKQELQMRESLAPEMIRIDRAAAAAASI